MNKLKITVIVLIAAAAIVAAAHFLGNPPEKGSKLIYEAAPGQQTGYFTANGKLSVVNQEGAITVDASGNKRDGIIKSYANPVASIGGDHMLLYDKNGTSISVSHGGKTEEMTTDLPLICAKINGNGYIAAATMETGYKGKITVYNSSGLDIYKWQMGNSYVVDMDISSDCKRLAVTAVSMTGKTTGCRVVMIDLDKAEIVGETTLENTLPLSIDFARSDAAILVTDNAMHSFDKACKEKWSCKFDEKILESYKVCGNGATALMFSGASNNNLVQLIDASGKKSGEYSSQNKLAAIDASESTVAVTDGNTVVFLGWNGKKKTEMKSISDVGKIVLLDSSTAALVGGSGVYAVKY